MNRDSIQDALNHISDKHIAEAATAKKRRYTPYIAAIAACLALIITFGLLWSGSNTPKYEPQLFVNPPLADHAQNTQPETVLTPTQPDIDATEPTTPSETTPPSPASPTLLSSPTLPELIPFPIDQTDYNSWSEKYSQWYTVRRELHNAPTGYASNLVSFWMQSIPVYLCDNGEENVIFSPISLYMSLAMLAQTTGGTSQQEILDLLCADSMEHLAQQARMVFENQYENDGVHTNILANSLWLDNNYTFKIDTIASLANSFYASVYQGALESPEMNIALKNWLSQQTGGLLDDSIANLESMDILTAMAIASTINYRCKWASTFSTADNTPGIFYSTNGDQTVTYMNQTLYSGSYYWGKDYCATYLRLDDGSIMWFILPDEDTTAEALLQDGYALKMILGNHSFLQKQSMIVNFSVPKFDISANLDLINGLQTMGVQDVFDIESADFSGICPEDQDLYLNRAQQGVRVTIDEEGLTGTAYTSLTFEYGSAPQEKKEVDFVLDRPFLFLVESSDGLPLFTGIVNQP